MSNRSRLLVPATLAAALLPAASASAGPTAVTPVSERPVVARSAVASAPTAATPDRHDLATYGEMLAELARQAALRAAREGGSDGAMEAISELAARWLETAEGATRVWDQRPRSMNSAHLAVRNARRSLWRTEKRHERIAAAAARDGISDETDRLSLVPAQFAAAELGELLHAVAERDRHLLMLSAQGMNAREIGRELGISHAAARQRLARARRQLRECSERRL
ncbi:MAG: sigma factor-like helix-turn-helix DNA-binding protein [Myxococcota bacterium]